MAPDPSDTLVGRAAALERLRQVWDRAASGRRGVVLVVGEAGIGKTSLLRTGLPAAATTAWATGDEAEIEVEHGVMEQLVRGSRLAGELREQVLGEVGADPLRVGARIVQVIDQLDLPEGRPLAVVLDDAQWIDVASLQAVAFAGRRLALDPVVLCLASRPDGLGRFPAALRRLIDDDGVRIDLEPLGRDDVQTLVEASIGRPVARSVAQRLHEHTDGNPLHLTTLLEERSPGALLGPGPLPAPRSFTLLVAERLAQATPDAEAFAVAVAILGERAPVQQAAALASLDDPGPALDAAEALGLVRVSADVLGGSTVSVAHPLVRAALLEQLPAGRRAALHRRAGELVGGPSGLRHRLAGTMVDDAELFSQAVASAEREARMGAHGTSASLYQGAAKVAADEAGRSRALLDAVDQLLLAGRLDDARALWAIAGSAPRSPRRDLVAAQLAYIEGPRRAAKELLTQAWNACAGPGTAEDPIRSRIAAMLATVFVDPANGAEAVLGGRRALEADPVGAAQASAAHMYAGAVALEGDYDTGLAALDEWSRHLGPDAPGPRVLDTYSARGLLRLWTHDLPRAIDDLHAALAASARAGSFVARESVRGYLAEALRRAGRWEEALQVIELTCSIIEDADQGWMAAPASATAASLQAARGAQVAVEHLARAHAAAGEVGGGVAAGLAAVAELEVAVSLSSPERGLAAGTLLESARRPVPERIAPWRANHAELLAADGDVARAATRARELAEDGATPLVRVDGARAAAVVADRLDDLAGLDLAEATGAAEAPDVAGPYPVARFELVVGAAWRRRGERRRATTLLEAAGERFRLLGAEPGSARVEVELNASGLRPKRGPRVRTELTPQEAVVARLVGAGRTNREVAAELVVSTKTVEHHLSRVYAKLGLRSRTELARHLASSS
jgi:DNA-binding CsgD family transcriptional regulator